MELQCLGTVYVCLSSPQATSLWVIPCQITQYLGGFPHFVLDFLYMLTICAKICLGNIFQVIASKVSWFLRYTAFSARRLGNIFSPLILVPTFEAYISATEADVVMKSFGPNNLIE